jgi:protein-S-isoprenylcysteine O-methyltransferase Ste14
MTEAKTLPVPTRFYYRYRGLLLAPPLLLAVFCTWRETENDLIIFPLGLTFFALGVAVRYWSQCHLHYRLSVKKNLTTSGPYRFVRNPIYLGNLLIVCGVTITSELLWFLPFILAWTIFVYRRTVLFEEHHLTAKYGRPYVEFCERVPRWMPRMRGAGATSRPTIRPFMGASVWAESHNLLILAPFLLKELVN